MGLREDLIPEPLGQGVAVASRGAAAEPVERAGVADDEVAEVLARAEELDQHIGRARVVRQRREPLDGFRARGGEPFEVRERHSRIGAPGQERAELPQEDIEPLRFQPPTGEVAEVGRGADRIADPDPLQP